MNVCFADLIEMGKEEFNNAEVELLTTLEFGLRIPNEELNKYLQKL